MGEHLLCALMQTAKYLIFFITWENTRHSFNLKQRPLTTAEMEFRIGSDFQRLILPRVPVCLQAIWALFPVLSSYSCQFKAKKLTYMKL